MTNLQAKLDGFRVYKIKNRGDPAPDGRKYTAPIYIEGLPGDVDLLNKELEELNDMENIGELGAELEDV